MKGWRMRVLCHVPSPLIPRPGLFTTTWSRPLHKDTWCYWLQSKPPSAHFLSSLAFLSLVNRITMKLSPSWSLSIKDADVSHSQKKKSDAVTSMFGGCLSRLFCSHLIYEDINYTARVYRVGGVQFIWGKVSIRGIKRHENKNTVMSENLFL